VTDVWDAESGWDQTVHFHTARLTRVQEQLVLLVLTLAKIIFLKYFLYCCTLTVGQIKIKEKQLGFIFVGHEKYEIPKFQSYRDNTGKLQYPTFFAYINFLQHSSLLSQKSFAPWRKENIAILQIGIFLSNWHFSGNQKNAKANYCEEGYLVFSQRGTGRHTSFLPNEAMTSLR
jgi:hypothetical protein